MVTEVPKVIDLLLRVPLTLSNSSLAKLEPALKKIVAQPSGKQIPAGGSWSLIQPKCYRYGNLRLFKQQDQNGKADTSQVPGRNLSEKAFLKFYDRHLEAARAFYRAGEFDKSLHVVKSAEKLIQARFDNGKPGLQQALRIWEHDFQPLWGKIIFHTEGLKGERDRVHKELLEKLSPEELQTVESYVDARFQKMILEEFYVDYVQYALPLIESGNHETAKEILNQSKARLIQRAQSGGWQGKDILNSLWDGHRFPTETQIRKQIMLGSREEAQISHSLRKDLSKKKLDLASRFENLQQGVWKLAQFDEKVRTPSLNHTTLRNQARRKLIEAYLKGDNEILKEFQKETETLLKVMEREHLVGSVFDNFVGQFPSFSSFLGETDFSKEAIQKYNTWIAENLGTDFAKPGMFEPDVKTLRKTKFAQSYEKLAGKDPERARQIKEGIAWIVPDSTRLKHIYQVRKPLPDLSYEPINHFKFPVEENASFEELQRSLKSGNQEIGILQSFLTEIRDEEAIQAAKEDSSGKANYFLTQRLSGDARVDFLLEAQRNGEAINVPLLQEDFLKDLDRIEDFYQAEYDRLSKKFTKDHPQVMMVFFRDQEDWDQALKNGIPLDLHLVQFGNQSLGFSKDYFNTAALGLIQGANYFAGNPLQIKNDGNFMKDWEKVQEAYRELGGFKSKKAGLREKVRNADSAQAFNEAYQPVREEQDRFLMRGLAGFIDQAEKVAKRGESDLSQQDAKTIHSFRVQFIETLQIKDPKKRLENFQKLSGEIQDFILGITIEQEIAMVKTLRKHDYRWGVIKGGFRTMATGSSPNYNNATWENFEPYQNQLNKAKRLFEEGKINEARKIYYALGQSKQRQVIIERGQSSARWSGLVIGIGIVAVSALTAGALTAVALPVGAEGLSLALAAGRFALNATVFWGTERILNGVINDQPILGRSHSFGGKIKELGGSWLETVALFGVLSGSSKVFRLALGGIFSRGATRLAASEGKAFAELSKTEKLAYLERYQEGLGRLVNAGIWAGHEATNLAGLNAFCAVTDPHYKVFSWDTQEDLLIFMAGLYAISPLSGRLIQKIDARKINHIQDRITELDKRSEQIVEQWEQYLRYSQDPHLKKSQEGRAFLRDFKPDVLLQEFRSLSKERIQFMKDHAPLFGSEGIQYAQAQFQFADWHMTTWMERNKQNHGELKFDRQGNITFNPNHGVKIIERLPTLFGEKSAADPQIWMEVNGKGVLDVTFSLKSPDGRLSTQSVRLRPRGGKVTPKMVEKMRNAIPLRNLFIDLPVPGGNPVGLTVQ